MNLSWKALGIGALVAGAALLLASLLPAVGGVSAQPEMPPNQFFGSVTLDGVAAPAGANVTATIDGTNCGQTTVEADSTYSMTVRSASGDNPLCAGEGDTVTFTVDGCTADTGTWSSGQFTPLDLDAVCVVVEPTVEATVEATVEPTVQPTVEATATPVVVTGTGGYLGGDSGTPSWAYLAGGLSLLLTAAGGLAAYRRYVR